MASFLSLVDLSVRRATEEQGRYQATCNPNHRPYDESRSAKRRRSSAVGEREKRNRQDAKIFVPPSSLILAALASWRLSSSRNPRATVLSRRLATSTSWPPCGTASSALRGVRALFCWGARACEKRARNLCECRSRRRATRRG